MNNTMDKNKISKKDVGHLIYLLNGKDLGDSKIILPKDSAIESMEMTDEMGRSVKVSIRGLEELYRDDFRKIANAVSETVGALKYSGELKVLEYFGPDTVNPSISHPSRITFHKNGTSTYAIDISEKAIFIFNGAGAYILQNVWNKILGAE